ncbi:MAG: hypothetical protein GY928_02305 [Colwellia sp.]|nr:hypothetical protein [Colwellia sp.]
MIFIRLLLIEKQTKTMKKLIIIILFTVTTQSQNGISFSVLQDVKLGLGMDKKHLNNNPTLDLLLNVNLEGKQYEYYFFAIQMQYEHAELHSGYLKRYSVHGMWNLNPLILPKLQIGFGFGLGMINREGQYGNGSYSGTIELSYPILKNLSVISKNEWVRRSDLETPKTGYNLSVGLRYKPFHL